MKLAAFTSKLYLVPFADPTGDDAIIHVIVFGREPATLVSSRTAAARPDSSSDKPITFLRLIELRMWSLSFWLLAMNQALLTTDILPQELFEEMDRSVPISQARTQDVVGTHASSPDTILTGKENHVLPRLYNAR
jgi:hypothetical protein